MSNNVAKSPEKWNLHETKLSTQRGGNTVTAINDNQTVIIGGYNDDYHDPNPSTIEIFDIKGDENKKNHVLFGDMVTRRTFHSSVAANDHLYVIGGCNNKSVYRMDLSKFNNFSMTASNLYTWETDVVPDIDEERSHTAAVVNDDYIYLFGGLDGFGFDCRVFSTCLRYKHNSSSNLQPNDNSWETVASMKTERFGHAAVKVADKIYVIGGYIATGKPLRSMEIFDPFKNKFEDGPLLPIALARFAAVSIANKYIVVNGGMKNGYYINEKTYIYDVCEKVWKTIHSQSMNTLRTDHAAAVLQKDKIFVCGGNDGNSCLDTIEWILFDELLHGKRWNRRKVSIIFRYLVEHGKVPLPVNTTSSNIKSRKEEIECSCFRHLISKTDDDVFRSVLKFL